jgi:hypothetical protein
MRWAGYLVGIHGFCRNSYGNDIPWPLLGVGILLAAAVGFLWLKLRGAERNLAINHETIANYDTEKQDLLGHEQQLSAVIEAISVPVCWRWQDLTRIGCITVYCETVLGESLELGVGAIEDEGRGLALTRSLVKLYGGALEIQNDAKCGFHGVVHFPIYGPALTSAKAQVTE